MARLGILLLHGTLGCAQEFTDLERTLNAYGYVTHAYNLPGHTPHGPVPLPNITAETLLEHCQHSYQQLADVCDEVVIIGHSLGGMLGLILAGQQPAKLAGVISLCAPYNEGYWVNATWKLALIKPHRLVKGLRYLPEGNTRMPAPKFWPHWLPRLQHQAKRLFTALAYQLPNVNVPVLLMHSPYDLIVPYNAMQQIEQAIAKPHLTTSVSLEQCGHQIYPTSREQTRVTEAVLAMLQSCQIGKKISLAFSTR